jgi:hypothetical protein
MTIQQVIDWQPFTQFTTRDELQGMGIVLKLTYVFASVDDETEVITHIDCEPPEAFGAIRDMFEPMFRQNSERLRDLLTVPSVS